MRVLVCRMTVGNIGEQHADLPHHLGISLSTWLHRPCARYSQASAQDIMLPVRLCLIIYDNILKAPHTRAATSQTYEICKNCQKICWTPRFEIVRRLMHRILLACPFFFVFLSDFFKPRFGIFRRLMHAHLPSSLPSSVLETEKTKKVHQMARGPCSAKTRSGKRTNGREGNEPQFVHGRNCPTSTLSTLFDSALTNTPPPPDPPSVNSTPTTPTLVSYTVFPVYVSQTSVGTVFLTGSQTRSFPWIQTNKSQDEVLGRAVDLPSFV